MGRRASTLASGRDEVAFPGEMRTEAKPEIVLSCVTDPEKTARWMAIDDEPERMHRGDLVTETYALATSTGGFVEIDPSNRLAPPLVGASTSASWPVRRPSRWG